MQILGTPLSDLPSFHISFSPPLFTQSAISERNYKHVDISSSQFFSLGILANTIQAMFWQSHFNKTRVTKKEISETNKKYQLLDIPLMTQKMCSRNPSKSISFYIFFLKNQWMTNPKWLTPTWTKLFTLCQK